MQRESAPIPVVLVIAGLDPSGGAGLVADVQTITALGAHPAAVATTITVQDTRNAHQRFPLPAALVRDQAAAVLADMPVAAIKLGLLGNAAVAQAVAALLAAHASIPVVLDPVLVAGGGAALADDDLLAALRDLLPRTTLLTPNGAECRRLAPAHRAPAAQARALLECGCGYVLLTGGDDDSADVRNHLFGPAGEERSYRWPRLAGSFHGSGCTLAAAAAAGLAHGLPVAAAVTEAQQFTWTALRGARRLGRGQRIPDRQT